MYRYADHPTRRRDYPATRIYPQVHSCLHDVRRALASTSPLRFMRPRAYSTYASHACISPTCFSSCSTTPRPRLPRYASSASRPCSTWASLQRAYDLYWEVIHDRVGVREAGAELDRLMCGRPIYGNWTIGGICSVAICSVSFSGSRVDSLVSGAPARRGADGEREEMICTRMCLSKYMIVQILEILTG